MGDEGHCGVDRRERARAEETRALYKAGVKLKVEINMEAHKFRYLGLGKSKAGDGLVLINLERVEGTEFGAVLTAGDAQRLLDDLPQQIRIATHNSN